MRLSSTLLQPHTGRRHVLAHEGSVVAAASNQRWPPDGLEIPCWNGEVVHISFAIDTLHHEIIIWVATQGCSTSGKMIRDMTLDYVERRFNAVCAPQPAQWLGDIGSAYTAAADPIDFATAPNLVPCLTPALSPESNGGCEALVKTRKRHYSRVSARRDAISVLQ
jgi:putative transposase